MKDKYIEAIQDLQNLNGTLKELGVKPLNLVATVGELLVMRELDREEIMFKPVGGQASCDIVLMKGEKCIEVKTSTQKENNGVHFFGWVVTKQTGRRQGKFDFLVCVGIRDIESALDSAVYYIFTGDEARKLNDKKKQAYPSIKSKLEICITPEDLDRWISRDGVKGWERKINENLHRFLGQWDRLK